jgi:hypothetical protein
MWHGWKARWVQTGFWWGDLRGRDHLEDLVVDGKVILKFIFKWDVRSWTGFIWLRIRADGGCCEYCIESSRSKNLGNLLTFCVPISFSRS